MVLQRLQGILRHHMMSIRKISLSCCLENVNKNALSQLRKKTGYPFINCRNALLQFNNNIDKAEEWLIVEAQKQGWAKASKLEGRKMGQGLIGVMIEKNTGAMAEVSCETDFVARNANFQELVKRVTRTCLDNGKRLGSKKVYFGVNEFGQLLTNEQEPRTIADLVALEVGSLGENMQAKRGVFFTAPETYSLSGYVHKAGIDVYESSDCQLGKYGALLSYKQVAEPEHDEEPMDELGRKLCQHIVGMNPETIGTPDDEPAANADEEKKLIYQEFLLDPEIKVHEFLEDNGLEVNSWVRFECGGQL